MKPSEYRTLRRAIQAAAAFALVAGARIRAQTPAKSYPQMAALEAYLEPSAADEIALARSAAPASIADSADILVFDAHGYHKLASGRNGFTCLVERSWNDGFDNPEFWNPRIRVPICFNEAAARTVLPVYLARTAAVLGTHSLPAVMRAARMDSVPDPAPGSFAIMMSRRGYLADAVGAAGPHTMVFLANVPGSAWGANLAGSPVGSTPGDKASITIFYLPARQWSDGTPIAPPAQQDHHTEIDALPNRICSGRADDSLRVRR